MSPAVVDEPSRTSSGTGAGKFVVGGIDLGRSAQSYPNPAPRPSGFPGGSRFGRPGPVRAIVARGYHGRVALADDRDDLPTAVGRAGPRSRRSGPTLHLPEREGRRHVDSTGRSGRRLPVDRPGDGGLEPVEGGRAGGPGSVRRGAEPDGPAPPGRAGHQGPARAGGLPHGPRHRFLPPDTRRQAYEDESIPIGEGQTITPPFDVAFMTEVLDPKPTDRVYEVGTGSGYQAAILSRLVKEVYSVEIHEPLGKRAAEVLKELGYDNVHTRVGDGYAGWPEAAPFDAIIVTCAPGGPAAAGRATEGRGTDGDPAGGPLPPDGLPDDQARRQAGRPRAAADALRADDRPRPEGGRPGQGEGRSLDERPPGPVPGDRPADPAAIGGRRPGDRGGDRAARRPALEDFEADANGDGVPDGWYNLARRRLEPQAGWSGPHCLRFENDRPGARPGRAGPSGSTAGRSRPSSSGSGSAWRTSGPASAWARTPPRHRLPRRRPPRGRPGDHRALDKSRWARTGSASPSGSPSRPTPATRS